MEGLQLCIVMCTRTRIGHNAGGGCRHVGLDTTDIQTDRAPWQWPWCFVFEESVNAVLEDWLIRSRKPLTHVGGALPIGLY